MALSKICLSYTSLREKHAVFKHLPCTFYLGEHLHSGRAPNTLTAVPERVRTNCKLMWVVNVPLTSVSSEEKINLFPPKVRCGMGLFLSPSSLVQAFREVS